MYLRSISMKGFKSFPERTTLEFSPGVSVIVGPNGSGKSNITDAVLWALGEQSPGAIRGASMQDVISAGGKGVGQRRAAEVEVTIDNSDGRAATDFSEIAVERRLDRSGDSGYRLNGARCRLADVTDVLSDTNLGREMHSEPDYSEEMARDIDDEIHRVIEEAHVRARRVLEEHLDELHRLSAILVERETIDKDQFIKLLEGATDEEVFPEEVAESTEPTKPKTERRSRVPKPKPFPLPGQAMQPPPPEGAKS